MKPGRKWREQEGEELVVRGSRGRRVQVARARLRQWTPRVERRFLKALEMCCNLRLALKSVGLSTTSLHEHRKRWPAFDDSCEAALETGFHNINSGLVAGAIRALDPSLTPEERAEPATPAIQPMTVDGAISLVRIHERRRWEAERGLGPGGRVRGRRKRGASC